MVVAFAPHWKILCFAAECSFDMWIGEMAQVSEFSRVACECKPVAHPLCWAFFVFGASS